MILVAARGVSDCDDGPVTDGGGNITNDPSCLGTVVAAAAIRLGPLADNGGPTRTFALLPGSVAINAAGACSPATDQRGIARPQGSACDAGAFEVEAETVAPTVTINQASGQADPTGASPINFTVVFSEPVSGFATGDVTLGGTAGATTATVTAAAKTNTTTYTVAVSGLTGGGPGVATILAGGAQAAFGKTNPAPHSTPNQVT